MLVLYIAAGIIVFLTLSLLIPIDFVFDLKTRREPLFSLRASWLFGLVGRDLHKRAQKGVRQKKRKYSFRRLRQIGTDLKTLSALIKLAKSLVCSIKVKRLSGHLKLGFEDPADTGLAFGLIQPLFACFSLPASADFRIEPDFSTSVLEGEAEGRLRIYPLRVTGVMLKFICSREGRYAIKRLMRNRKR